MAKKNSVLKNMVSEAVQDLQGGKFPRDPSLMDEAEEIGGPARFEKGQQRKDEAVIDQLLSGISGKVGYYMKIKKEVRPNEFMMMKVIESDWRKWADMEVAVSDIVKEHTKVAPLKWGTGPYRVEIGCKTGMRGETYPNYDFYINAEEEFMTPTAQMHGVGGTVAQLVQDPATAVASQIDTLSNLVGMLGGIFPKPPDPTIVQGQIAGAFKEGMQLKVSEGSNNSQMMTTMMTGLMGMMTAVMAGRNNDGARVVNPDESLSRTLEVMKNFGVLGQQQQHKEKTIVELVMELKAIGVDLFKKDDPMDQIGRLKQMAGIASEFMGMGGNGDKPSILEKIVDVLGPSIPKMISDIKDATQNTVRVQQIAGDNIRNASQRQMVGSQEQSQTVPQGEPTTYSTMNHGQPGGQVSPQTQVVSEQVKAFFNALHESVMTNNRLYYPVIYTSLLQDVQGQQLVQGIVTGQSNAKNLIDMLQEHGDPRFKESEFVMKYLVSYVNGFMVWVKSLVSQQQTPSQGDVYGRPLQSGQSTQQGPQGQSMSNPAEVDVRCMVCGSVFTYQNQDEYIADENKICGNGGTCEGALELVKGNA